MVRVFKVIKIWLVLYSTRLFIIEVQAEKNWLVDAKITWRTRTSHGGCEHGTNTKVQGRPNFIDKLELYNLRLSNRPVVISIYCKELLLKIAIKTGSKPEVKPEVSRMLTG